MKEFTPEDFENLENHISSELDDITGQQYEKMIELKNDGYERSELICDILNMGWIQKPGDIWVFGEEGGIYHMVEKEGFRFTVESDTYNPKDFKRLNEIAKIKQQMFHRRNQ